MREMKDSGIEWIGEIPKDWKIIKGKYVLEYLQKPVKDDDGVITCFRDGEVTLRSNRREDGFTLSDKEIGYQGIDVGDLVVHGMDGFAGAIGISDSRGKASPVLNVFNSKYSKRYLMYYLRSMAFSNVFIALASGIRVRSCDLSWNKLANLPYPTTSYEEQTEIVRYIDSQCSEIDATAEDIQKEISLLEDYKKSVITEAVTKGLNPDAEMKDSGIEWIGQIPKHWKVVRLEFLSWVRARLGWKGLKADEYVDEGYPFLSAFNIQDSKIKWEPLNFITKERFDESPEIMVACGDVLLLKDGAGVGKCARIDSLPKGDSTVNSSLAVITCFDNLNYRYLYYSFNSSFFSNLINLKLNGMGVPHLTQEELRKFIVLLPCVKEQQQIADFLDAKCSEIDAIIADKKRQRGILADYKKSLIYEYVTGKKEVPVHE